MPYDMAATKPSGERFPAKVAVELHLSQPESDITLFSHGTAELHFVVSNDVEKPNPELRKFIRSHVMQGKNLGKKTRPSRKRGPKRLVDESSSSSDTSSAGTLRPDVDLDRSAVSSTTDPHHVVPVTIPRKFGSFLSTIHFADAVEPGTVEVVLHCELSYHM